MASEANALRRQAAEDIQGWDAIAEHRTGTEGDRQTAEWLADAARREGTAPVLPTFPLARWALRRCVVEIGAKVASGVPLFDSATTGPEGVAAPLSLLPATGGIGLGTVGPAAGGSANGALFDARRGDAQALVAVAKMNAAVPGLALQNADSFAAPFGPPVLQVATEHEDWLYDAAGRGETARVTVDVVKEDALGHNVALRIPGAAERRREFAPLVVMTPKSSWWTSTAERGGGIAVWLALLRHFVRRPPARDVCFLATSGHELGHLGLEHQLREHPRLAEARAWLHLGANFAAKGSRVRLQSSDAALRSLAHGAMAQAGAPPADETAPGKRPGGEARNIYDMNGSYVSLLGTNAWFHHPDDRWPETIDVDATARLVEAMIAVADSLSAA